MDPEERLRKLGDAERWDDTQWRAVGIDLKPGNRSGRVVATGSVAVAVVAAGALAFGLTRHGSTTTAGGTSPNAIPWAATPASATSSTLPSASSVCDPSELTARSVDPEPVGGSYAMKITLTNAGPACSLPNSDVLLEAKTADGSVTTLATSQSAQTSDVPTIPASGSVAYEAQFGLQCGSSAGVGGEEEPAFFSVGGTPIPTGANLQQGLANCSDVTLTAPPTSPSEIDPYPQISADIQVPSTASSGSTLDYTVTLTNNGSKPFAFSSCPTYTELVNVNGQILKHSYTLNCGSMPQLQPGQSATFSMQTPVPAASGTTKLGWFLGSGGPSAVRPLTVN